MIARVAGSLKTEMNRGIKRGALFSGMKMGSIMAEDVRAPCAFVLSNTAPLENNAEFRLQSEPTSGLLISAVGRLRDKLCYLSRRLAFRPGWVAFPLRVAMDPGRPPRIFHKPELVLSVGAGKLGLPLLLAWLSISRYRGGRTSCGIVWLRMYSYPLGILINFGGRVRGNRYTRAFSFLVSIAKIAAVSRNRARDVLFSTLK